MLAHKWQPISPQPGDCGYDFSEIDALQRRWLAIKREREEVSPGAYSAFLERLTRSWAIETGIIEGLYTLDPGVTETLVMRGISAELIDHDATDKDPQELALMLDDHQNAALGVYAEIREGNPITRSAIRQIHAALTSSQPTFTVMDQFGNRFETKLDRGGFKTLPNNPTRRDGTIHEYCSPEHVDSELDNLLSWYDQYLQDHDRFHPLLTAAWLHHRFTQIHPFQDGNGRVVRTLLTWHLVRVGYLPVVVKRDDRADYIDALEKADDGKLLPFVDLLVRLQKRTIMDALGEIDAGEQPRLVDRAIDFIVEQIHDQNVDRAAQMQLADTVAKALRDHIANWLEEQSETIRSRLERAGSAICCKVEREYPRHVRPSYYLDLEERAQSSGYPMSPGQSKFFATLSLTPAEITQQPKLRFAVYLYHTGRQFTGIMVANAFTVIEYYRYGDEPFSGEPIYTGAEYSYAIRDPFMFTLENEAEDLFPRFKDWAEQKLAMALHDWGEQFA